MLFRLGDESRLLRQTFPGTPFMVLAIYSLKLCLLWFNLICASIRICPSVVCARCLDGPRKCFRAGIVLQDQDLWAEIPFSLCVMMNFTAA